MILLCNNNTTNNCVILLSVSTTRVDVAVETKALKNIHSIIIVNHSVYPTEVLIGQRKR